MVTWVVTGLLPCCYRVVTVLLPGCYQDVTRMFLDVTWALLDVPRYCWMFPSYSQAVPRLLPGCYLVLLHRQRTPVPPELADMFDEIDIEKNILEFLAGYAI